MLPLNATGCLSSLFVSSHFMWVAAKAGVRKLLTGLLELQSELLKSSPATRQVAAVATSGATSASANGTAQDRTSQPNGMNCLSSVLELHHVGLAMKISVLFVHRAQHQI